MEDKKIVRKKKENRFNYSRSAIRNRRAGHQYERDLALQFRELGYSGCQTSRYASRILDDCKVDLNLPDLNVQAKNVKSNMKYEDIFDSMHDALEQKMPERIGLISTVFHKKQKREHVILQKEDFYRIWKLLKINNLIKDL